MKFGGDFKTCSGRRSIRHLTFATFIDAAAAHDRNVADHELAAEDARTRLDMRVVTQCEVRDVCNFTDFNPIELAFAKLKAFIRAARARTFDHVCDLIAVALGLFTPTECRNFVRHCGYRVSTAL